MTLHLEGERTSTLPSACPCPLPLFAPSVPENSLFAVHHDLSWHCEKGQRVDLT